MRSLSGPAISIRPPAGSATAARVTAVATSSAAIGWNSTGETRTLPSSPLDASAIHGTNSKNCVAWTIVYGIGPAAISSSWAIFARM